MLAIKEYVEKEFGDVVKDILRSRQLRENFG